METYRIVTSVRGSSLNGLVSIESPLGKALLGHKEGDRVFIKVNDDFGYYVIVKMRITSEVFKLFLDEGKKDNMQILEFFRIWKTSIKLIFRGKKNEIQDDIF